MQDHEDRTSVTKSEVESEVVVSNIHFSFVGSPRLESLLEDQLP
jgi:hypothetical protein